ncbi:MAG: Unknown protein [uncultured Thiotrichaceae bacterium]|uniref:CheW-like domain-containing protein n=1 Tax=uncultured Thiotrichaceae bacterium TaxID=298394 RepID=A0A6S6TY41_9GAMM|nr:MAG: Unknown protein [uncultured Thiotrichaceae bacterium]
MLSPHGLIVGMALIDKHNQSQENYLSGLSGILVKSQQYHLLIKKERMLEIQTVQEMTRAIDDRRWLTGLIQYNGHVIPLIEISMLLNTQAYGSGLKDRQVIVVNSEIGIIGLLVEKVLGYRDFWTDDKALESIDENKTGIISHTLNYANKKISILSMSRLAKEINQ